MALPPGWNWQTGDIQELIQHILNNDSRPNQLRQPLRKFWSEPYQTQYNQYFKSLQFNPTDTAPVHELDRAMVAVHDDVTPTIESLCREWQGIKVWPVLFFSVRVTKTTWRTLKNFWCPPTCNPFHFRSLPARTLRKPVKPSLSCHSASCPATTWSKREIYPRQVRTCACWNIFAKY